MARNAATEEAKANALTGGKVKIINIETLVKIIIIADLVKIMNIETLVKIFFNPFSESTDEHGVENFLCNFSRSTFKFEVLTFKFEVIRCLSLRTN